MKKILIAVGVIVFGAAAITYELTREPPLYSACEEVLKDRLRAPSTYKRVSIYSRTETVDGDELVEPIPAGATKEMRDVMESRNSLYSGRRVTKYTVAIEYDAANGYGTPLRGTALCEDHSFGTTNIDDYNPGFLNPKVDGYSKIDWITKSLKN